MIFELVFVMFSIWLSVTILIGLIAAVGAIARGLFHLICRWLGRER